jgi:hypothetical protein
MAQEAIDARIPHHQHHLRLHATHPVLNTHEAVLSPIQRQNKRLKRLDGALFWGDCILH